MRVCAFVCVRGVSVCVRARVRVCISNYILFYFLNQTRFLIHCYCIPYNSYTMHLFCPGCTKDIDCGLHGSCNISRKICNCNDGYQGNVCEIEPGKHMLCSL